MSYSSKCCLSFAKNDACYGVAYTKGNVDNQFISLYLYIAFDLYPQILPSTLPCGTANCLEDHHFLLAYNSKTHKAPDDSENHLLVMKRNKFLSILNHFLK